jgi:Mg2+/Co2+ transporter CorB
MIYLILYVIGFALFASFRFKDIPDSISTNKILLTSLFYPLSILFTIINIPLSFVGVYLQFQSCVIMSKEEIKKVTDKEHKELRDMLDKILEEEDKNEEK